MRRKKRVGLAVKVFVAVFAVYAAVTLVSLQLDINAKRHEQSVLRSALDAQKVRNDELEDIIANGTNEEYIAKIARESLDYITPGEKVFVDISSK